MKPIPEYKSSPENTSESMGEFTKFAIARVLCAVLSYGAYLLMLLWFTYQTAYVASYVIGIALAYYSNATLVFNEPLNRKSALLFPMVYVLQFAIGYVLIKLAVESLHIRESLGLAFSVLITLPMTFLLSRWVMRIK
ncbi:GtrA family protein [Solilutibacter silvestris]|uniref:GtrA-like protein n=1 Tax=Solilutibacter silvestris TaxID=1645665 RepID=A0A2K1Q2E3_9GAMM|nr:GtrA family protein [Lysobacter silvestris]PNS09215.1 GtrA-like protein [Lysobacter silvestris]